MPASEKLEAVRQLGLAARQRLASILARPFQSVPSRIILSVFSAALVASLAVAWVSTQTIASFLRSQIDERFPAALERTSGRLEFWYAQRQIDIQTFARSSTLLENAGRLSDARSAPAAREEIHKYLAYVLGSFPQYAALFLFDAAGERLLWVGEEHPLPETLRRQLAGVTGSAIGDFRPLGGAMFQVASAPVLDAQGQRVASLHALLGVEALAAVLGSRDPQTTGTISLVAPNGRYLIDGSAGAPRERYHLALPEPGAPATVEDYALAGGTYVVGSAVRFPRFGWTLVVEEPYDAAFAPLVTVVRRVVAIDLGIVLLFSVIAYLFARSIVRPIIALSTSARRVAEGEAPTLIPETTGRGELGVLVRVFNEMTTQLSTQYEQLQRANEVLEQLSITDGLTRLHNHRYFQDALPREMRRSQRTGEPLCLILIDVDDFKGLNDRFGHAVGDAVLRRVSELMNDVVRETDLLARYGGEEFALLASHTELDGGVALAEKVRTAVAEARFPIVDLSGRAEVSITVSVGVAPFRGDEKGFFNEADRALYRAKANGKDCVAVAD